MKDQRAIWRSLVSDPRSSARLNKVMWRVATGLSEATGRAIRNDFPLVDRVPIAMVPTRAGGPEEKMVGVYLVIGGGLRGQAILILSMSSALNLADLMLGNQPGVSTQLGVIERSALSELGNMTLSYFLNGVASFDDVPDLLRPSPPAVMVDMLGAILNVVVAPVAAVRDDLLIIETAFYDQSKVVDGRFWILPDPSLHDLES
jgi:chemotaxis protein CheC